MDWNERVVNESKKTVFKPKKSGPGSALKKVSSVNLFKKIIGS
jgi:hypothetical protein